MIQWKLKELKGRVNDKLAADARRYGSRREKITFAKISEDTGVSTSTLVRVARNEVVRADFGTIEKLLNYFSTKIEKPLQIGDLLEYIPDEVNESATGFEPM